MKAGHIRASVLVLTLISPGSAARAAVTWPADQLLPSFPSPAASLDLITLRGPASSGDELALFASLKGAVNVGRPRVFSYEGDAFAEGPHAWLQSLGLTWTEVADAWTLIGKYRSELAGVVVYDPAVPDTLNLATTLAGRARALVATPALLPRLTGAPYNLPIIDDLRGRFANKLAVYRHLHDVVWPTLTHRVVVGLSPDSHKAGVREYAAALGAAVIWLDPRTSGESAILDQFLAEMDPGAAFMGWWPEEQSGIERASRHAIATVASDFATNLTVHGGMPRKVDVKPIPAKPILGNKIYVAFWISDGDNLQYVEHLMRKLWNDGARGKVAMGWTVSPAMLDAMPGALDYYHRSASAVDVLISGPSGWGYAYPNSWMSPQTLAQFIAKSDDYALRAGLRVMTVWNTITGGINPSVGSSYATNAPSLLGLSAQNTGGGLTVYDGKLPAFALSCNYCTTEQAVKDFVAGAAKGWNGNEPRFIAIQAQPWQGVTPTSFANVRDGLGADYVVVRPDSWFQLLRQANRLPLEPHARLGDGVYRIVSKASGKCVARRAGKIEQLACADDEAQRWRVVATDAGYARVQAATDATSLLNVEGGGAGDGPLAIAGSADQQWQAVWEAGLDHHLVARLSDRCLEVPNGTAADAQLRQWTCTGAGAQAFRFADPAWPPAPQGDAGAPTPDAGAPREDAAAPPDGSGGDDAGDVAAPSVDAPGDHAGTIANDGGTVDAARAAAGRHSGCSMAAGEAASSWPAMGLIVFVLLGAARRRRGARLVLGLVVSGALGVAGGACSSGSTGVAVATGGSNGAAGQGTSGVGGGGAGAGAGAGGTGTDAGNAGVAGAAGAAGAGGGAGAGVPDGAAGGDGSVAGGDGGVAGAGGATPPPPTPLTWGAGADFPYRVGNYDEPLRPQFHFTAPMGWLNDPNGLWYEGGLYHLSYQASPFSLASEWGKFWGHATSPDLVHWTHVPIMLHPGANVPGPAWSGSTVEDVENTSGLQTGARPALVTLYTDTDRGTSIAYSNDRGLTWKAYANNPVAIGGADETTRDPHVFWYQPTRRWVCVYYEDAGISVYTSPDLKTWKKTSHVPFGFECPDAFELPVDGDAAKRKWVLLDAGGGYLLGAFDGEAFKLDSLTPLKMNMSSEFYASQTFYRRTFPDDRVVQVAWIRGSAATAPWNQALTFPVEVRLRTFPEGVRLTRTPIAELSALRGAPQHLGPATAAAQVNALAPLAGRTFDLVVTIDRAKTTASTLTFGLGAARFTYDVAKGTMWGATVSPADGRVTVRILRDLGQYEVYVNDGEVSYTKDFAFGAADDGVSLTASVGQLALVSADLYPLARAWPGVAARTSAVIDDAQPETAYSGSWTAAAEDRYFRGACRVGRDAGSYVEATFTGTRVDWYGLENTDLGRARVSIDGTVRGADIDTYSAVRQNARLFTVGGLAPGRHTIRVEVTGAKSASSSGTALVHDYFIAYTDG